MKVSRGLRGIAILAGVTILGFAIANLPGQRVAGLANPVVQADGGCSVASLNGPYGLEGQGTVLPGGPISVPAPVPFGEVIIATFNGAGTFFGSAAVNVGGVVLNPVTFTGTYTVNPDCTGTITVNLSLGFSLHNAIVVLGGSHRLIATDTDPFEVVQRRGERLGD